MKLNRRALLKLGSSLGALLGSATGSGPLAGEVKLRDAGSDYSYETGKEREALPSAGWECAVGDGGGGCVEDDRVVIRVRDDGPGIAPRDRERIFTPFYTTKDPGKGVGLGLAVTREIIDLHRGGLTFEDPPDGGIAFVLTLPKLDASAMRAAAARAS